MLVRLISFYSATNSAQKASPASSFPAVNNAAALSATTTSASSSVSPHEPEKRLLDLCCRALGSCFDAVQPAVIRRMVDAGAVKVRPYRSSQHSSGVALLSSSLIIVIVRVMLLPISSPSFS